MSDRFVPLSVRAIQTALFWQYKSNSTLIPNWAPPHWWEADLARIMPSGRWVEVEIKLSVKDFRADGRKMRPVRKGPKTNWHSRVKHLELAAGDPRGPNQFYYALPEGLIGKVEVPAWAGIMSARTSRYGVLCSVARPAPELHRQKHSFDVPAKNVFYWRLWSEYERQMWNQQKALASGKDLGHTENIDEQT